MTETLAIRRYGARRRDHDSTRAAYEDRDCCSAPWLSPSIREVLRIGRAESSSLRI